MPLMMFWLVQQVCINYLEQSNEQVDRLNPHVHVRAVVELLPDVLHEPAVARFTEHPLCGRAPLPQQHQHILVGTAVDD